MADNINYRLVADVIKFWRQDTEERALGAYILSCLGISLGNAQAFSLVELTDVLRNYAERGTTIDAIKEEEVAAVVNEEEVFGNATEGQEDDEGQDAHEDEVVPENETTTQMIKREKRTYAKRKVGV